MRGGDGTLLEDGRSPVASAVILEPQTCLDKQRLPVLPPEVLFSKTLSEMRSFYTFQLLKGEIKA